jgi:hypothetical protein
LACESGEVGIDRVDVNFEQLGNEGGRMPSGKQKQSLGAATLPGLQRGFQTAVETAKLLGGGRTDGQGTRHGRSSQAS